LIFITKVLLVLIAAGLWANAAAPIIKPTPAYGDNADVYLSRINDNTRYLSNIDSNIRKLAGGSCSNPKLR
jgi:hypothetical protein